jgi:hypothetical protein
LRSPNMTLFPEDQSQRRLALEPERGSQEIVSINSFRVF